MLTHHGSARSLLLCVLPVMCVLLLTPALAQVSVTVSPLSKTATQRIFSRRVAKTVTLWICSLENGTDGPVSISESAVLRHIPQLQPIDVQSMRSLIAEAATNSGWARTGRLSLDVATLTAFLAANKGNLNWGPPLIFGMTAVGALAPAFASRIKGAERPVSSTFEALAWSSPLLLQPGESGSVRVFTVVWPAPQPASFSIDVSKVRPAKVLK